MAAAIRRRRECLQCEKRFTTYEYVETAPLMVIKKDGRRQSFDTHQNHHRLEEGLREEAREHGAD